MNDTSQAVNSETQGPPPVVRQTIKRLLREGRTHSEIWEELSRITRTVQLMSRELSKTSGKV